MATTRGRDIVVVAASAGGLEALRGLLSQFTVPISATMLVVLHVPAAGGKVLPRILDRAGLMPASAVADGEAPLPGHVYVAPPDCHMLLVGDKIRLSQGPRHNGHRPAADPLFISAALSGGPHTIAVVLSGTLDDGAASAAAVERRGGVVAIQDPGESAYDGMPRAAMAATRRAKVLRLPELAAFIDQASQRPVSGQMLVPDPDLERQLSVFLEPVPRPAAQPSPWSGVTCPECGGPLQQEDTSVPVSSNARPVMAGRRRACWPRRPPEPSGPCGQPSCGWKNGPGSTRSWPKPPRIRGIRCRQAASGPAPCRPVRRPVRSVSCWNPRARRKPRELPTTTVTRPE
jgi:two-component system chemotaxis response regulator CheB